MKKATRVLSLTMAAAMAAGVLGGCSSSAQGGTASTADTSSAASTTASSADSGNVIRVGVVCSMTGGSAIYGEGAQNAVDMAVEEINSGDYGYTVEIVNGGKVADDAKDAKQAMNAYNKVMADPRPLSWAASSLPLHCLWRPRLPMTECCCWQPALPTWM